MKKHYGKYPGGTNYYVACGLWNSAFYKTNKATRIRSKVGCKNSKRTKNFRKEPK